MPPKLSVITPILNGIRFIGFCLQNVIEQKCPDAEHIIIDGGSIDGTVNIIRKYAEKHSHIRWVSEKDKGQSDAMNKGIRMARGEILGFLNADDYYEPNVLPRVIEIFTKLSKPSILVGNCNLMDNNGKIIEQNLPSKLKITDLMQGWEINQFPVNPSQYFYHKSLHDRIGFFNIDDHFAMDLDFLLRAVQAANVKYINEFWGNYRFIHGTKTFEETVNGRSYQRCVNLLNAYKRNLSFSQKIEIKLKSGFYRLQRLMKRISNT